MGLKFIPSHQTRVPETNSHSFRNIITSLLMGSLKSCMQLHISVAQGDQPPALVDRFLINLEPYYINPTIVTDVSRRVGKASLRQGSFHCCLSRDPVMISIAVLPFPSPPGASGSWPHPLPSVSYRSRPRMHSWLVPASLFHSARHF